MDPGLSRRGITLRGTQLTMGKDLTIDASALPGDLTFCDGRLAAQGLKMGAKW